MPAVFPLNIMDIRLEKAKIMKLFFGICGLAFGLLLIPEDFRKLEVQDEHLVGGNGFISGTACASLGVSCVNGLQVGAPCQRTGDVSASCLTGATNKVCNSTTGVINWCSTDKNAPCAQGPRLQCLLGVRAAPSWQRISGTSSCGFYRLCL